MRTSCRNEVSKRRKFEGSNERREGDPSCGGWGGARVARSQRTTQNYKRPRCFQKTVRSNSFSGSLGSSPPLQALSQQLPQNIHNRKAAELRIARPHNELCDHQKQNQPAHNQSTKKQKKRFITTRGRIPTQIKMSGKHNEGAGPKPDAAADPAPRRLLLPVPGKLLRSGITDFLRQNRSMTRRGG